MNNQESTKYWERMTKYFSNELTEREKSMFEEWAMEVDKQKLFNEMKKDMSKMDEAKYVFEKSTDQAWADLSSRIHEDEMTIPTKVKRIGGQKMFYQIAAALIIVFGFLLRQSYFEFIPWYFSILILLFAGTIFLFSLKIIEIKNIKKLFRDNPK